MKKSDLRKIFFRGLLVFLFGISGVAYIHYTWKNTENEKFEHAFLVARSVVATLPMADLKALEAKRGDIDKPQYQTIKNGLQAVIKVNPDARFAYLYAQREDKIFFIADSEPIASADYSPPGQEYKEAKAEDKQPFKDGKERLTAAMPNRWGTWMSVLIPVKDELTGKTFAVFGMDFNTKAWDKDIMLEVIESGVLIALLLLTLYLLFAINKKNIRLERDIIKSKHIETVLRESEEKYRYLFASNPQPMWIFDVETLAFLEVNESAVKHYGYSKEEFLSMTLKDIRPVEDIPTLLKDVEQTTNDFNHSGEWRHIKKNGELIFVEITTHSVIFRGRNARNALTHDITKRKLAEGAMKESQSLYHSLLEQLPVAIFRKDREGRYVLANSQFCKLKGVNLEDLIGKKPMEVVSSVTDFKNQQGYKTEYTQLGEQIHEQILLTGKLYETEEEYPDKDGGMQYMHIMRMPVFDSYGKIIGSQGIIFDITQSKLAEEQVKLLSRAIEQSPVSVVLTTKDGNIEYTNPKFTSLTGYTFDEVKGKKPRLLQSGPQTKEFDEEFWNTILSGKDWQGEFHNKKKNGESYWESTVISSIVNSKGEISSFIAVTEDITDKKKMLEDLIKTKEHAEESDKLKTSFLNNISHEIRTPFNGILGFLSILQEENITKSERDEYISIINKSAFRLMNTINDIVEMAQIQAGQIAMNVAETSINILIDSLLSQHKNEAANKALTFTIANNLPNYIGKIYTDSKKLKTILSNLIVNAIKFTKKGSIELGIHDDGDYLIFAVKDTGIGISENKLSTIFERFMQADVSSTRQFDGSGLGLSISAAYVEMLGGKIWVESEEGKGSVFHITIPYHVKNEDNAVIGKVIPAQATDDQINPKGAGLKVLIAEDDEGSAMLIDMTIRILSNEVLRVKNGIEAIEACRNNPDIDLVLMDIKMPDMNGYEATRQIREFNTNVVIIAQTAYTLTGDQEKAIEAGCNDYLSKPIKKDQLVMLLEKYFKK